MEHPLISFFSKHLELSVAEKEFLHHQVPIISVKNHDFLLKEGEISTSFFFVIKGLVRMFYLVDGLEKTTFFYESNDFVSSYESFTRALPAKHYLQAIQDCQLAVFDAQIVAESLKNYPRFEMLSRIIMEAELSVCQDMIASFITQNAEQRYLALLKNKAHLLQEIPQYHIATYLGVSPETLSRIKRRIKKK